MRKTLRLIGLAALVALVLWGTVRGERRLKIGFSQMENNNPWRINETNDIRAEAARRGYELVYTDAHEQTQQQVADVLYLIQEKVDYIILAPREYGVFGAAFRAAKKARIPVILVDRDAAGKPGADYITLISSDFIQEGERAAQWLVRKCNGRANIVELSGTAGSSVARDRAIGFRKGIAGYPRMRIIASQNAEFMRIPGQKVMEGIIQAKGSQISAVFAHNDEMAIGAIQALKAAGMIPGADVVLVSVDGEQDALKAIIAGELGATVECNPHFGKITFDVVERHRRGERIPTHIINPDRFFDSHNAKDFVNESY